MPQQCDNAAVSVSGSTMSVVLTKVLRDVVRMGTTPTTVAVDEVPDGAGSRGVSVADEADPQQTAYGVGHIAQKSKMVANASVGSQAAAVVGGGDCDTEKTIFSYCNHHNYRQGSSMADDDYNLFKEKLIARIPKTSILLGNIPLAHDG